MIYDVLFPTVVARSSREDLVEPVKNIIQSLDYFEDWRGKSNTDLYILDKHLEVKEQFENEMRSFLQEVMEYGCDIKMTTSWFTKVEPNANNIYPHNHKNSWYSGCFYLQDNCQIEFENINHTFCQQIDVKPENNNSLNSISTLYTVHKGGLLMFPSQLIHRVLPTVNWNKTRYSLAFNVMPVGKVGSGDSTYVYGG